MNEFLKTTVKILTANPTVRKSTNSFFVTLVGGIGLALSDGDLVGQEVAIVAGTTLVTTAAVWKARNKE